MAEEQPCRPVTPCPDGKQAKTVNARLRNVCHYSPGAAPGAGCRCGPATAWHVNTAGARNDPATKSNIQIFDEVRLVHDDFVALGGVFSQKLLEGLVGLELGL